MSEPTPERKLEMSIAIEQSLQLETLYDLIDDLWANIGTNEVQQLEPETRILCQFLHEERWHRPKPPT